MGCESVSMAMAPRFEILTFACSDLASFRWHVPSPFRHGSVGRVAHCPALGLLVSVGSLSRAGCRIV